MLIPSQGWWCPRSLHQACPSVTFQASGQLTICSSLQQSNLKSGSSDVFYWTFLHAFEKIIVFLGACVDYYYFSFIFIPSNFSWADPQRATAGTSAESKPLCRDLTRPARSASAGASLGLTLILALVRRADAGLTLPWAPLSCSWL